MPDLTPPTASARSSDAWLPIVVQKLQGLRYGVVQIVVHDSQVVQIERTERTRLDRADDGSPRGRHGG